MACAVAAGLTITALAATPAAAATTAAASGHVTTRVRATPPGPEPGAPTPAPGEQLVISTYDGHVYTIDPSSTDACQNQPSGISTLAQNSPLTMTPDGTVWTSAWYDSSKIGQVGTYNPSSVNWAIGASVSAPDAVHTIAGLLAINATTGLATGWHSSTLMSVDFKTGATADIGDLPTGPGDGMAWATNGDLLVGGYDNHIYRLPASVLQSALNGSTVNAGDWLDLGSVSAAEWANSKWYDPFTWGGTAQAVWYNPFTWGDSTSSDHIYGLATGSDGTLYIAMKYGKMFTLAPGNVATSADSKRALQVEGLRNLTSGNCSFSGDDIDGMTITDATRWAPAATDSTAGSVSGTAGQPVTGTVTSGMVQAPVTVTADPATLPAGVTIGDDGTITGTPVAGGNTTARVKVCGQDTCVWKNVNFTIAGANNGNSNSNSTNAPKPPPADPSLTLSGNVGEPLTSTLPGSAASAPSTFTVTDPSQLPQGVSIGADGKLMGIPAAAGTFAVPVKACNATGCTTGTATLTVGPSQYPCDTKPTS